MIERVQGRAEAIETPIGLLPDPGMFDLQDIGMSEEDLGELFRLDPAAWREEFNQISEYLGSYGPAMPRKLGAEAGRIIAALG